MRRGTSLFALSIVFFSFNPLYSLGDGQREARWPDSDESRGIQLTHVRIHCATGDIDRLRRNGNNTLGGPGAHPGGGASNFAMDAYTAPTWATSFPSVFTWENYSFEGGSAAQVDHRVIITNNAGPWPTPVSLAFIWQECGNGTLFPPYPRLYGTSIDGGVITLPLFDQGIWYITLGFSGFTPGDYDWVALVNFDGISPIPVPDIPPNTDAIGSDIWNPRVYGAGLQNLSDEVGDGLGSGRPWCFKVLD